MNQLSRENLYRENKYLEEKIKQLGEELNQKCKTHLLEMEKTRDLYQEQVVDLIEERDDLEKEIEHLKIIIEQKDLQLKELGSPPNQTTGEINTLKEELEKRDKVIQMLEQNLKQLGEESISMINFIEQKYASEIEKMKN